MERTTLTITYEAFSPPKMIQLSITEIVLRYFTWWEWCLEMIVAITWAMGIRSWDSCYYATSSKAANMCMRSRISMYNAHSIHVITYVICTSWWMSEECIGSGYNIPKDSTTHLCVCLINNFAYNAERHKD